MTRKVVGRGAAVFALVAGLAVLAAQSSNADHTSAVPTEPVANGVAANTASPEAGTIDMSNWQTTRETKGPGSKFKPKP
jgi:hypothetical protein